LQQLSTFTGETQHCGTGDPARERADLFAIRQIGSRLSNALRRNFEIAVVVVLAMCLYSAFMSTSFGEQDGINFALALSRYDVFAHRPHPPGYPVFVFVSSIIYRVTQNPLVSLTSVSALSGALTLIPTYAIAKRLFNREIALFSVLALLVAPGFWLVSEQAVSDMFFTMLLTLAMSQLLVGRQSKVHLYASWATLGFALGVRPFNLVFIIPFLTETSRVARRRDVFYCVLILLSALLLAFLPAVLLTGYQRFAAATFDQLTRHLNDDVNPFAISPIERIAFLLLTLANGLGANFSFSVLSFYPFASSSIHAQLTMVMLLFLPAAGLLSLKRLRDYSKALFMLSWVVPYLTFVYLLGTPGYTRYMTPIIPPILIGLTASAFYTGHILLSRVQAPSITINLRRVVQYSIILFFAANLFLTSLPLAAMVHTEPAANVQLVSFVHSNYDPATTIIIVFHEFRAFQFYGAEYRYIHCCHIAQESVGIIVNSVSSSDTVLITSSALAALQRYGVALTTVKVAEFSRSPLVNFEDASVTLYHVVDVMK
jgi:hypothetical protein